MCLLAIFHRVSAAAPVMLAANREEYYDRPFLPPRIEPGSPRVFCPADQRAGGTWLGVNQHGVLVAITNRLRQDLPAEPRSRGSLCREALNQPTALAAADYALAEFRSGRYGGANCACLDRHIALVVIGDDKPSVVSLPPGLHLLTNADPNDPQDFRQAYARTQWAPRFPGSPSDFISAARRILALGPDESATQTILVDAGERGTVCSSIITLAAQPDQSQWWYAHGRPDRCPYEDLSAGLRETLAAEG